jgi:hypothetical protein
MSQSDSFDANKSIKDRLGSLMIAAERLNDHPLRITHEEIELLSECASRLRLIRGDKYTVPSASVVKRAVAN